MTFWLHFGNQHKEINIYKYVGNLEYFQDTEKISKGSYTIHSPVDPNNLESFMNAASTGEIPTITLSNAYDFYQLSIELKYKQFETKIHEFLNSADISLSNQSIHELQSGNTLDRSFFDELIAKQMDRILNNNSDLLDQVSTHQLCNILSQKCCCISNMNLLCDYILKRFTCSQQPELDMNICLFPFIDCSNLNKNRIDQLIPISEKYRIYIHNLTSRALELENQKHKDEIDKLVKQNQEKDVEIKSLSDKMKQLSQNMHTINKGLEKVVPKEKIEPIIPKSQPILQSKSSNTDQIKEPVSPYEGIEKIEQLLQKIKDENIKELIIPRSLGKIKEFAFSKSSLTKVVIPSNICSIERGAFSRCQSLEEVIIPSSVKFIRSIAFSGCANLKKLELPLSVTVIGSGAFNQCTSLTAVNLPPVQQIESGVFTGCTSLEHITISSTVTTIGTEAFKECTSLKQISLPKSLHSIQLSAFSGCTSLETIAIPFINSISSYAFFNCKSLKEIALPLSITQLEHSVFSYCTSLTQFTIPSSVKSIGNSIFSDCTSLTQITIPFSITKIPEYFCANCTSLESVVLPGSITTIGKGAFNKCSSLIRISIPSSVTKIEDEAFRDCPKLDGQLRKNLCDSFGPSIM